MQGKLEDPLARPSKCCWKLLVEYKELERAAQRPRGAVISTTARSHLSASVLTISTLVVAVERLVSVHDHVVARGAVREGLVAHDVQEQVLARRVRHVAAQTGADDDDERADGLLVPRGAVPEHLEVEEDRQDDAGHRHGPRADEVGEVNEVVLENDGDDEEDHNNGDTQRDVLGSHEGPAVVVLLDECLRGQIVLGVSKRGDRRARRGADGRNTVFLRRVDAFEGGGLLIHGSKQRTLVHAQNAALSDVEHGVQDHGHGDGDVQLHEQVGKHNSTAVRVQVERRSADGEEQVTRDLAADKGCSRCSAGTSTAAE
ncbi:hypothetical protein ON010_g18654 [Phytophthora cinnamomi]|nr:hypothetical protein ON010_g18654 [Phytophthora cinnamomi]